MGVLNETTKEKAFKTVIESHLLFKGNYTSLKDEPIRDSVRMNLRFTRKHEKKIIGPRS